MAPDQLSSQLAVVAFLEAELAVQDPLLAVELVEDLVLDHRDTVDVERMADLEQYKVDWDLAAFALEDNLALGMASNPLVEGRLLELDIDQLAAVADLDIEHTADSLVLEERRGQDDDKVREELDRVVDWVAAVRTLEDNQADRAGFVVDILKVNTFKVNNSID